MSNITEGSKKIANYLGWVYIPFNDLQGLSKAGWYETKCYKPILNKILLPSGREVEINFSEIPNIKEGWKRVVLTNYKYVCRNHDQLRFYNSMDALLSVISKLEKEDLREFCYSWKEGQDGEIRYNFMNISFTLWNKGCYSEVEWELDPPSGISSNFEENSWVKNTFKTVVETIEYVERIKTRVAHEEI